MNLSPRARLAAGALIVLWGCGEADPVVYGTGQTVPFGPATFSVEQVWTEETSDRLQFSVNVRVDLPSRSLSGANGKVLRSVLVGSLEDGAGRRYRPIGIPLPEQIDVYRRRGVDYSGDFDRAMNDARKFNESMTSGELPEEWTNWIVLYSVPRDAGSLRLLLRNPVPRDGQPRMVAVPIRT